MSKPSIKQWSDQMAFTFNIGRITKFPASISGSDGNDFFLGSNTTNTYRGWDGTDTISYQKSNAGVNVNLATGQGFGGAAHGDRYHTIENATGSYYNDTLTGNSGDNVLSGLNGNDTFKGSLGSDTIKGGRGQDTLDYSNLTQGIRVDLTDGEVQKGYSSIAPSDSVSGIETVIGTNKGDTFKGNNDDNTFHGLGGDDDFSGDAGADSYYGGAGLDQFFAETSHSTINVANGTGSGGILEGDTYSSIEMFGLIGEHNTLIGSNNAETLGIFGDTSDIDAAGGNDTLIVGGSAQTGSLGNGNFVDGGAGNDTLSFEAGYVSVPGGMVIDLASEEAHARNNTGGVLEFANIENAIGTWQDDIFYDGTDNNVMTGGYGSDTFIFDHDDDNQSDTITDFETGIDKIDLDDTEVSSWNDLNNSNDGDYMEQVGNNVVIHSSDTDTITLENVNLSDLSASDFIF